MIPFFQSPTYRLGPFTIELFGVFAALGIYLGAYLATKRAAKLGLDSRPLIDFAWWGVVSGVIFGHLVHLFLYHREELDSPWQILKVWSGLSSFGGLLGGVVAAAVFFRHRGIRLSTYGDALALGIAPGWSVARIGCFVVHDHPGVLTKFFLAVNFGNHAPYGIRHDLGLYDALWLATIGVVLYLLAHRHLFSGRLLAVLAVLYGIGRFFFDFLRATDLPYVDARYLGLTPGQYACFLIIGWGIWQLIRREHQPQAAIHQKN